MDGEFPRKETRRFRFTVALDLNLSSMPVTNLQRFIERVRQITQLTELTPEIVHEFIEKNVVSRPDKQNGKRHQQVDIYYNTIGLWSAPDSEVLEREYLAYYKAAMQKRKKTA